MRHTLSSFPVLGRTATADLMLRCVLLFAVSSGNMVNSVTVKAPGSNTPKPNDPIVVRGWRSDGYQKMDRTPKKAEKTLGKEVAPNDDLFNTNDYQKYYGASPRELGSGCSRLGG